MLIIDTGGSMGRRKGGATGAKNPNWKGGRHQDKHGYIHIKMPLHPNARKNGYVFEHTLVMAEDLGRPLEKGEIVHHIHALKMIIAVKISLYCRAQSI
jgi:hypothetical protein